MNGGYAYLRIHKNKDGSRKFIADFRDFFFFLRFLRNVLSGFATRLIEAKDKQRIAQGQR